MAAAVWVLVEAGTPEPGLWCPVCLAPSAARVPLVLLTATGARDLGAAEGCPECGHVWRAAPAPSSDHEGSTR